MLERGQDPTVAGRGPTTQAEELWSDNGARAKKENGCELKRALRARCAISCISPLSSGFVPEG